jgi:hypothetical protein
MYRVIPGGKTAGALTTLPSSVKVKERVELAIHLIPFWAIVAYIMVNFTF